MLVTRAAFGGVRAPTGPATLWLSGWLVLGGASATTLFVALLGNWRTFTRGIVRFVSVAGALGVFAWLSGLLAGELWRRGAFATFVTVAALLRLLSFELQVDAAHLLLELDGFAVVVSPMCSGIEGVGLFCALIAGFLLAFRRTLRFPNALWLVPLGIAAVWLGNAVRIASLMLLGAYVDPAIAIGSFHSKAGWVLFCAITIAVAALVRAFPSWFLRTAATPTREANPATPFLLPLLLLIAVGLVTSSFSAGHDPLYALRVLAAAGVLWHHRGAYRSLWQRPGALAWSAGLVVGVVWVIGEPPSDAGGPGIPGGDGAVLSWGSWALTRALGSALVVPVCEELAFVGFLARRLTQRDFESLPFERLDWRALFASSLAFGMLHERWLAAALSGVLFASVARRSGRLVDAIAAHATSNAVIAAWVLATQSWQHW